ncbi:hypothetical protein FHT87_005215 [Rhizobium sp. BK316]|uniref:pentapeptide repeat-containing protein n=1 Tax=Rhizobium sp. BK316 TaxID=2587053 RepID=UPI0016172C53|nr:pentapeptide repeat-containing protein [Rhizobium sp. BK316]MBB3411262.1 hypothetical protein [Rhizobium sp. BK316]
MQFNVLDRFSGEVKFTAEIDCDENALLSVKLGLAVKWAIKEKADLRSANLSSANLRYADLRYADLRSADLRYANLSSADLRYANLSSADLRYANLSYADLRYADLRSADLSSANLSSAKNAELAIAMTRILPEGSLIGWKKCMDGVIVKLRIPEEAKRSHAFGRKCRAEYADVIEVIGGEFGISLHDRKTKYVAGQRITPDKFDEDWAEECSNGIHFFVTRLEAENYSG